MNKRPITHRIGILEIHSKDSRKRLDTLENLVAVHDVGLERAAIECPGYGEVDKILKRLDQFEDALQTFLKK